MARNESGVQNGLSIVSDRVELCASDMKDSAMGTLAAIPEERRPRMVVIWRDPAMPSSSDIIRRGRR